MEVKGGPGGARTLLPGPPARTGPALSPASGASLASHELLPGLVRIGGADPDALGYEDLVAGVAFMEQDSQLLSGTVADNLRLARPDAGADELHAAMKVAVLAGHIDLASEIGPGGEGLSGGQRRRLGVAPATCAPRACCCSTSPPRASTARRLAPCWKISARPFPARRSSPPFTTARSITSRCPRTPWSGWPRGESTR